MCRAVTERTLLIGIGGRPGPSAPTILHTAEVRRFLEPPEEVQALVRTPCTALSCARFALRWCSHDQRALLQQSQAAAPMYASMQQPPPPAAVYAMPAGVGYQPGPMVGYAPGPMMAGPPFGAPYMSMAPPPVLLTPPPPEGGLVLPVPPPTMRLPERVVLDSHEECWISPLLDDVRCNLEVVQAVKRDLEVWAARGHAFARQRYRRSE